jgi:hypothetical protein
MLSRSSFVCKQHQVLWYSNYIKKPGANPTIVACNASAVKNYNATSSLLRFENKIFSSALKKRSSLLKCWRCSCKFRNRRISCWKNALCSHEEGTGIYVNLFFISIVSSKKEKAKSVKDFRDRSLCMYVPSSCMYLHHVCTFIMYVPSSCMYLRHVCTFKQKFISDYNYTCIHVGTNKKLSVIII